MTKGKRYHKKKRRKFLDQILEGCPRIDIMIHVSDDWYPNYPNDQVKLSIFPLGIQDYVSGKQEHLMIRVLVSGLDDYALEQDHVIEGDFETFKDSFDQLSRVYKGLLCVISNKEFFLKMGFTPR